MFALIKKSQKMISHNKVVTVTYSLHAGKVGEKKTHIETAEKTNPLLWLFGVGSMIPGFEAELANKKVGDTFDFELNPNDAYGELDAESIVMLPLDVFKDEQGNIDKEMLTLDNVLPMRDNDGNNLQGKVMEVTEEFVRMDFNHPLAGNQLQFKGEILEVREATADELAHGHAHGPDDHHHH